MRPFRDAALLLVVGGALPWLSACSEEKAQANSPAVEEGSRAAAPAAVSANLTRAQFRVEGMTCGGCVIGTRAVLARLEGVEKADASYDDSTGEGTAWALYDPARTTPERMMEAIRELGYTPTLEVAGS